MPPQVPALRTHPRRPRQRGYGWTGRTATPLKGCRMARSVCSSALCTLLAISAPRDCRQHQQKTRKLDSSTTSAQPVDQEGNRCAVTRSAVGPQQGFVGTDRCTTECRSGLRVPSSVCVPIGLGEFFAEPSEGSRASRHPRSTCAMVPRCSAGGIPPLTPQSAAAMVPSSSQPVGAGRSLKAPRAGQRPATCASFPTSPASSS